MVQRRPEVQMVYRRQRAGYVTHNVTRQISVIPTATPGSPSPHAVSTTAPSIDFSPRRGDVNGTWMERREAARDPDLSAELQMRLARDTQMEVRIALAQTTTHPNVVELLITDGLRIRQALAEGTDELILSRLTRDPAWQVRSTVLVKTSSPLILTILASDSYEEIARGAAEKLAKSRLFPLDSSPMCQVCTSDLASTTHPRLGDICRACDD
jgi:hypothetical protein